VAIFDDRRSVAAGRLGRNYNLVLVVCDVHCVRASDTPALHAFLTLEAILMVIVLIVAVILAHSIPGVAS
jgi:hypothetical protein